MMLSVITYFNSIPCNVLASPSESSLIEDNFQTTLVHCLFWSMFTILMHEGRSIQKLTINKIWQFCNRHFLHFPIITLHLGYSNNHISDNTKPIWKKYLTLRCYWHHIWKKKWSKSVQPKISYYFYDFVSSLTKALLFVTANLQRICQRKYPSCNELFLVT